jgi:hypothetical protein
MNDPLALTRRTFVRQGTVLALAAGISRVAAGSERPPTERPMTAHRNLFNGDCNFLFYNPELWQPDGGPYRADAIHRYVDLLARSGVDTLLVNPNTQVAWYPSKRVEYLLAHYRRGDREFARRVAAGNPTLSPAQAERYVEHLLRLFDLYLDLTDAGVDWLAECAKACRARGIHPWLSYRMNPTHFSGAPECPANAGIFHDPSHRLSGKIPGPEAAQSSAWIGLNYARPAVRGHMLAMIRDGISAYDYSGVELDWLRHPVCLEHGASNAAVGEMTEWFAAVKATIRDSKPHAPLGLRIPSNLTYLREIGIDVRELVARGIVDFLTFSNYWQTPWEMPHDELRRLLGPDVTIYGGMEDAPNWLETQAPDLTERLVDQELQLAGDNAFKAKATTEKRVRGTRYLTASVELMRANAAGKLVLGADGLEQFNFFVTDQVRVPGQRARYDALQRLDDLEFLRGKDKHYAFNTASTSPTKLWDVPEQLPVSIAPGHRCTLRIPMCAERDAALALVVQVVTEGSTQRCSVSVNGSWPHFECEETRRLLFPAGPYREHVAEHRAWNYLLSTNLVREGWNEFTIGNESPEKINVTSVELAIKRIEAPSSRS